MSRLKGRITVAFYTDSGRYMGWRYLSKAVGDGELRSWLRSGNYVKVLGKRCNTSREVSIKVNLSA
jgi:hypothetical protein